MRHGVERAVSVKSASDRIWMNEWMLCQFRVTFICYEMHAIIFWWGLRWILIIVYNAFYIHQWRVKSTWKKCWKGGPLRLFPCQSNTGLKQSLWETHSLVVYSIIFFDCTYFHLDSSISDTSSVNWLKGSDLPAQGNNMCIWGNKASFTALIDFQLWHKISSILRLQPIGWPLSIHLRAALWPWGQSWHGQLNRGVRLTAVSMVTPA